MGQSLRFLLVGGAATLTHILAQYLLHDHLGVPVTAAFWTAFGVAFTVSFTAHYTYTFRSQAGKAMAAARYLALQLSMQVANYGLFMGVYACQSPWAGRNVCSITASSAVTAAGAYFIAARIFQTRHGSRTRPTGAA